MAEHLPSNPGITGTEPAGSVRFQRRLTLAGDGRVTFVDPSRVAGFIHHLNVVPAVPA